MHYRNLGRSDISVSEIGFGTWGLGGDSYGAIDHKNAKELLRFAFNKGINFFDTSDLYGQGRCEELIGETFSKKEREDIIIATKGGTLPHSGYSMPQNFSKSYLENALNFSLKRLDTNYIDIYHLHNPPQNLTNYEEIFDFFEGKKEENIICEYAISASSPFEAKNAIEEFDFPIVQFNFNLIDQRAIDCDLFSICESHRTGVIIRTPLNFGYLSGKLKGDESFSDLDHRRKWPHSQRKKWSESHSLFETIISEQNLTYVQLALKYCLHPKAVSSVIPGMMNMTQIGENILVSDLDPLSQKTLKKVRNVYMDSEIFGPLISIEKPKDKL